MFTVLWCYVIRGLEFISGLDKISVKVHRSPGHGFGFLVPRNIELKPWKKSQHLRHSCLSGMWYIHYCIGYMFMDLYILCSSWQVVKTGLCPHGTVVLLCFVVMWYSYELQQEHFLMFVWFFIKQVVFTSAVGIGKFNCNSPLPSCPSLHITLPGLSFPTLSNFLPLHSQFPQILQRSYILQMDEAICHNNFA